MSIQSLPTLVNPDVLFQQVKSPSQNQSSLCVSPKLLPECQVVSSLTPVKNLFKEKGFSTPVANNLIEKQQILINELKENSDENVMCLAEASADQATDVYYTPGSFRVVTQQLGRGGQGTVYEVERAYTDSNKPTKREALKILNTPPASGIFEGVSSSRLNLPLQQYNLRSNRKEKHCATLPLGEGDLHRFDFTKVTNPIQTYLSHIKDVARGADDLHSHGIIHRDIKPHNVIVLSKERGAQLGDLDLAARIRREAHFTTCTPDYAPSSIWDFSISRQANRRGIQTKADDVYSLGRTLQYGLIQKVLSLYIETTELAKALNPKRFHLSSDEISAANMINQLEHDGKVIAILKTKTIKYSHNGNNYFRHIPEYINAYPSNKTLSLINANGVKILKQKLSLAEYNAFKYAAFITTKMQADLPKNRPTMKDLSDAIENQLRLISEAAATASNLTKRELNPKEDENSSIAEIKKARMETSSDITRGLNADLLS